VGQVLRACGRAIDAVAREGAAPLLARLVPDLGSPTDAPVPVESTYARFALFDAVTAFLAEVARGRPVLVVLGDVHAADRASLLLLQFVARTLRETAIVVPTPSYARSRTGHYDIDVYRHANDDARHDVALGAGITTGVLALVGGALWYYFHHRHTSPPPVPESTPAPATAD